MMSDQELSIYAIPVEQPIGEFFVASVPARNLVNITYRDIRRLVSEPREVERYLGVQRPISKKRVKDLKRYIATHDATFPTAIILAVDEESATYDPETFELTLLPSNEDDVQGDWGKIARILDGQHRLAAFTADDGNLWDESLTELSMDLNVAIFIGADISEQASIFATVNLAQTKVNKSLVYDLTELAKKRSPFKSCHNIAVALESQEKSPLRHRIKRLGVATPGRKHEPLTQAAFVESLVRGISRDPMGDRNNILDGRKLKSANNEELIKTPFRNMWLEQEDLSIAKIVFNYFDAVRERWPRSWSAVSTRGNLLPRANAFKALMKFLIDDVYRDIVGVDYGRVPRASSFFPYFEALDLSDDDFTTRTFVPGSGGQARFLAFLRQEISRDNLLED